MGVYSRSGRVRPKGGGWELAIWYLMRLSGVALFVLALAHFLILHVVSDPANQDATYIINQRWNTIFWRGFDWLLLQMVLLHSFLGVRTVVLDYVRGGPRTLIVMGLYLLAFVLFVLGTIVVMTLPSPGAM